MGQEIAKAVNSSNVQELQRKLCQRAKWMNESLWKKMIGKPYSGKLNVRFDEGELEIEPMLLRQLSTLPKFLQKGGRLKIKHGEPIAKVFFCGSTSSPRTEKVNDFNLSPFTLSLSKGKLRTFAITSGVYE